MSLSTKNIITLLSLKGVGRTSVLCHARYAEQKKICIQGVDDYLHLIAECHENEGCRVKAEDFSVSDLQEAELRAERIMNKSLAMGINIVSYSENQFPEKLKDIVSLKSSAKGKASIKEESPVILYYKGDSIERLNNVKSVAIIGTREPTPEGRKAGLFLSKAIAKQGINIVGGLAIGCDTFGHEGAIEANGMTTAFLAHGLHTIYPKENEALAAKIVNSGGLLISEYPIGTEPYAPYFVERDRLQSGISDATIVIQTGVVGGTMHAVNATIMNGKPLFAIEYSSEAVMRQEKVLGNRKLISEHKAIPVTSQTIQECINLVLGKQAKEQTNVQEASSGDNEPTQLTLW